MMFVKRNKDHLNIFVIKMFISVTLIASKLVFIKNNTRFYHQSTLIVLR